MVTPSKEFTRPSRRQREESAEMGTIAIPDPLPSPVEDSENLRKAVQGWGTDEKAIIRILGRRNGDQRAKIRDTYEEMYKENLIDRLHSELSGDFRRAVIQWTLDPPQRDAQLAKEALKKKGLKQLEILIEIACASSPEHLINVRKAYCSLFKCSLEEDVILHVNSPLKKLLVSLISSYRFNGEAVDEQLAREEAAKLREAIGRKALEDDSFTWILSTRNMLQLNATFNCYRDAYGTPIDQDIKESINSDLARIIQTTIWCIENPEKHFAQVIRSSIVGLGTDEDSLTRAIVARAEIDMEKIKETYYVAYKVSLLNDVVGDTSGYYKDMLVTLLGEGQL